MIGDLLALFWVFLDPFIEGRAPYLLLVPTDEFQTFILHCGLQMWFQSVPSRANIHSHHLMAADPVFQKHQCLPKTWELKGVAFGLWSRLSASHYSNTQDAEWSGEKGRRQHSDSGSILDTFGWMSTIVLGAVIPTCYLIRDWTLLLKPQFKRQRWLTENFTLNKSYQFGSLS